MGRSRMKGIVGGLIGGLIATIPWILLYVYTGVICSYLAFIIGIGVLKGYQYKGLSDRNLSNYITIISLVCVSVATLIIIPFIIFVENGLGYGVSLIELYSNSLFVSYIMRNYIIAILFTFIGLKGITQRGYI